jgi:hypothetical protein
VTVTGDLTYIAVISALVESDRTFDELLAAVGGHTNRLRVNLDILTAPEYGPLVLQIRETETYRLNAPADGKVDIQLPDMYSSHPPGGLDERMAIFAAAGCCLKMHKRIAAKDLEAEIVTALAPYRRVQPVAILPALAQLEEEGYCTREVADGKDIYVYLP